VACDPCEPVCVQQGTFGSAFTFGGWIESGVFTNSRGFNNNGPMHTGSIRRNDFVLNQLVFNFGREMDTRRGFDWGANARLVYGAHAGSMQTWGDGTFDDGWGDNKHGYSMAAHNLYGTLGYRDLSIQVGKFGTPIGWEGSGSEGNFFYSRSYCYWIEPATHMGVMTHYDLTDRLSLSAGWTTGMDSSFANPYGSNAVLTGFEFALADDATIYYYINAGRQGAGLAGEREWADYFNQSLCFEWALTNRFTYVLQYNLFNINERGGGARDSSYGINNHFLYKLDDRWSVGKRVEWLRDNAGLINDNNADYYQVSLGLNWSPFENVSIRPEIRYDWVKGATPFGTADRDGDIDGRRSTQLSGGCGIVVSF
jgi:hypothetical protein